MAWGIVWGMQRLCSFRNELAPQHQHQLWDKVYAHLESRFRHPRPMIDASYDRDGRLYICFEDATGIVQGEGGVSAGDDQWPDMVSWEMGSGTILPDDARELGLALIRLAEDADRHMAARTALRVAHD